MLCDGLVARLVRRDDPKDLSARGLHKPYFEVRYDFILVPSRERSPKSLRT